MSDSSIGVAVTGAGMLTTAPGTGAESMLITNRPIDHLPAESVIRSTITQICEGTAQLAFSAAGPRSLPAEP
jgi:hypothetical protein